MPATVSTHAPPPCGLLRFVTLDPIVCPDCGAEVRPGTVAYRSHRADPEADLVAEIEQAQADALDFHRWAGNRTPCGRP